MTLSHNLADYEIRVTEYSEHLYGKNSKFQAEALLDGEPISIISSLRATEQDAIEGCVQWIEKKIADEVEEEHRAEIRKNPVSVKVVRAA